MSDDGGDGVWFRRRTWGLGYNFVPITWQGWLMTFGLGPILIATVFAGDPSVAKPSSIPFFLRTKALLGLSGAHLPAPTIVLLLVGEVAAFLLLLFWKSRALRPLD